MRNRLWLFCARHIERSKASTGTALVEFALVLPMLLLLMLNAINFGTLFYSLITVSNAARVAAEYATYNGAAVSSPGQPTGAQTGSIVTNDVTTMLNKGSIQTQVCHQIAGGSATCAIPGLIAAPDASSYALTAVTVTYTYQPVFTATLMGIPLTLGTSSYSQQIIMRNMQ